jgi:hypothetical protein
MGLTISISILFLNFKRCLKSLEWILMNLLGGVKQSSSLSLRSGITIPGISEYLGIDLGADC